MPPGTPVKTPSNAHKSLKRFHPADERVEMVGFFSTMHQGVFAHYDSFLQVHLITADRKRMGHLDRAEFKSGEMGLFLAEE